MLNRYRPILDTNWVVPVGHDRTSVIFDVFFRDTEGPKAGEFIERQRGLGPPAHDGRTSGVESQPN